MKNNDYIEVDVYIFGIYQGRRKIGKNSICGALLSGNISDGINKASELITDLNQIPGVKAKMDTK